MDPSFAIQNLDTGTIRPFKGNTAAPGYDSESDMEVDFESATDDVEEVVTAEAANAKHHKNQSSSSKAQSSRRASGIGLMSTISSLISKTRNVFSNKSGTQPEQEQEVSQKAMKCSKDDFLMLRVIGKGSFAKVILVRKKGTDQLYAMKVLSKTAVVKRKQVEHTRTERKVLEVVGHLHDHPYISQMHFAFQTESKLYLVLHYCSGGEVFHHLQRMKRFPERWARLYAAELVLALSHLHKFSVAYRDLKPENILLDEEGHIKICDFGLSKDNVSEPTVGASSLCGTPEYLAPEVLDRLGHGTCVDWWGLGMVLYELLTGLPPWYTTDRKKLFARIRTAPLKFPAFAASNMSAEARGFITQLLNRDPSKRLGGDGNVQAILDHPFFTPACGLPATSVGHPKIEWHALMQRQLPSAFRPDSMVAAEPHRYSHDQRAYISREPERFREHTHMSVHEHVGQDSDPKHMARNFDPEHARLPFDSEVNVGGGIFGSSVSYAHSPVSGDMFTNFTFDEGTSPHLSLEEDGKTLTSIFKEEEAQAQHPPKALAKRLNFTEATPIIHCNEDSSSNSSSSNSNNDTHKDAHCSKPTTYSDGVEISNSADYVTMGSLGTGTLETF